MPGCICKATVDIITRANSQAIILKCSRHIDLRRYAEYNMF